MGFLRPHQPDRHRVVALGRPVQARPPPAAVERRSRCSVRAFYAWSLPLETGPSRTLRRAQGQPTGTVAHLQRGAAAAYLALSKRSTATHSQPARGREGSA